MKACTLCGATQPPSEFYMQGGRPQSRCKTCHKNKVRQYNRDNREIVSERKKAQYRQNPGPAMQRARKWKSDNRPRVRELSGLSHNNPLHRSRRWANLYRFNSGEEPVALVDLGKEYRRMGGSCGICGDYLHFDEVVPDHIFPISLGGEHVRGNLQPAHLVCNTRKSRYSPVDFTQVI